MKLFNSTRVNDISEQIYSSVVMYYICMCSVFFFLNVCTVYNCVYTFNRNICNYELYIYIYIYIYSVYMCVCVCVFVYVCVCVCIYIYI